MNRIPASTATSTTRRRFRSGRLSALTVSMAAGLGLVAAPVISALTASPAGAATAISAVAGSFASSSGAGDTTLPVTTHNVGDVLVVSAEPGAATPTLSSISGGGVTTWTKGVAFAGTVTTRDVEIWYGTVTATAAATITFNWSSALGSQVSDYSAQEFTAGLGAGAVWTADGSGHSDNTVSSTTVTYPPLTPSGSGELYFGFADMPSAPSAGATTGFSYPPTANGNQVAFNPATGSGLISPTGLQGAANPSVAVGMFLAPPVGPVVNSVSPSGGPIAGGTSVTVTGTNLTGATAVNFGGTAGTGVSVNGGGTSLTVNAPAEAAGTINVTVTTPAGTSATSSADDYTYFAVPTVTGVAPNTGTASGGTSVTVTGTNLAGETAVKFGATAGTGVSVNGGGTSLTVNTPAGAVGTVDVTVTTPGGTSATSAADKFAYVNSGYWMVGNDGGIFSFGGAPFEGSLPGLGIHVKNIVGMVPTSTGKGYWMVGSDGGVFAFGDAGFVGSLPGINVHVSNIVAVVPTSTGKGYWMIGSDGGVFAFGDAGFVGSLPGINVHVSNIVAAVPTSTGKGYWMSGTDGGVFAFGDAGFVGSLPGINVHVSNIVGA
ncbi:MAG TPA: IPT/TIG domain-containing protein, partial [Acidimicrobiales bacterium]|nr:IPT/TIG domain-containing protein [Acidimicrobiales bacterium]